MAIPFLNNINLDDNQLLNAKLHVTSSAPTAAAGQIYFDSTAGVTSAKYYDGATWVSLIQHTYNNSTFINLTEAGTDATRTLTADLSATGTPDATKYLRGDNTWALISNIPGNYDFRVSADTGTDQIINSGDTLDIAGGTNISTVVGAITDTVTVNLDDSVTLAGTLTVNGTGQSSFAGQVTIPTTPVASTDAASKAYVDASVAGGLVYQGGYDANLNIPDLTTSPNSIEKGWTYTVTADGTFFGEQLRVGDVLIAEVNSPSSLADWTTVQNNIDLASLTQVGIGNVNAGTGISVSYSSGTATVTNTDTNASNTDSGQITAGSISGTVTHNFGSNKVIVQTYLDSVTDNYPVVYCDITRTANSVTATIATAETSDIIILVQKIG
jgi:hypothetical protein